MLKTLDRADIKGKKILLRVGYDITLKKEGDTWVVPDDERIRATLPTIQYLLEQGCAIIVMGGWIGRPKPGVVEEKYKMDPVARRLAELLGKPVKKFDETVGKAVEEAIFTIKHGEIIMLENTRFNKGETEADPSLAREMAKLGDFVVFDAFAQAMRVHASTTGILENHRSTSCVGLLMERELTVLGQILKSPMEPFVVVLGGAKVSDKIAMVQNFLDKVGIVLVGGALANPFFQAKGMDVGGSLTESVFVDEAKGVTYNAVEIAKTLLSNTARKSVPHELIPFTWPNGERVALSKIQLPLDVIIAKKKPDGGFFDKTVVIKKLNGQQKLCNNDEAILDIGHTTSFVYNEVIKRGRTIFWNGPMGYFEDFNFRDGTRSIANAVADSNGFSVIGGGDTEGVIAKFNLAGRFGHVSTGGGASLSLLAGEELAVLKYLN
ncbi:MAG: phosphoglycerate kinase [Candidatus Jacksonbacteria bacterium RIFOXYA2_FULL_44_7]|uniref:Phosphoglycerate kinase n=1 Tax=Candidatus Jacksonbacteria bacterium RIFCSPLOWO2_02_FULL_44_20 TaxID=1798460 RepID=A0A1G2A6K6_9BACT|nr:MAG: Phosphoglycerate kinase [Parcubacteria group bacterium GW2011_GWC2_44_17]OGY69899.1 MAG: phosphoglycerate kinase [Candidatus Jacksonbacteria bacterium RIFCSPHIGHO2_02_FULL_44_25]OGY72381.1 MAG: phosphoglycerate kinase [Candidatus Jacksonbacteria bacterium RIFCSPLOWO2_02_FULL_44_20]OGY73747.1 MAG: phosphoglycerate kinase [Candidatus Jacksonbacteria bacterium RIFCSPLOWO2_12_FULL_44_15b]OGY74886.1 MAG: phosphoglycerate kinase [Candidatus Jacksonbacteria bacterium RIFOXYA2_FULL_44_7]HCA673